MMNCLNGQILGIGIDLVDVRRIERIIAHQGDRFLCRVFTKQERLYAQRYRTPGPVFAKRFAAKEAFSKAIGCGIGHILSFQDMDVRHSPQGQPFIDLCPHSEHRVNQFLHSPFQSFLSLTDEYPYVQAFVIITRPP